MSMKIADAGKEYKASSHIVYSCQYHVIFCPKFRRNVLTDGIDVRLKELFSETAREYDFEILEMEIMPDHVHMILDCNPRFGVMECISKLKGISSRAIREEFPGIKKRLPTLWTRSVFVSSVGSVSLEVVKRYILDQKNK